MMTMPSKLSRDCAGCFYVGGDNLEEKTRSRLKRGLALKCAFAIGLPAQEETRRNSGSKETDAMHWAFCDELVRQGKSHASGNSKGGAMAANPASPMLRAY